MRQPKNQPFAPRLNVQRLSNRSQTLRKLVQQASTRVSITEIFNSSVPVIFKDKFQVNLLEQNTLTLTCHSASLMTRFRFNQNEIINNFNQRSPTNKINNIKIKVRPKQFSQQGGSNSTEQYSHAANEIKYPASCETSTHKTNIDKTISKKNAQNLNEEAEHTDDLDLKNILLRLSRI